jgi:tetratricopeptide (TPR) repeat protein
MRENTPGKRLLRVKPAVQWAVTAVLVVLAGLMIVAPGEGLVPRVTGAETKLSMAKSFRNKEPVTADNLLRSIGLARAASRLNPLDVDAWYVMGQSWETLWHLQGRENAQAFHEAVQSYRQATELNPGHCAAHYRLAMLYRDAGIYEKRLLLQRIPGDDSGRNTVQLARQRLEENPFVKKLDINEHEADTAFLPCVWAMAETLETYPTNARYRFAFGQALYLAGLERAAATQYDRAIGLHKAADIDRLQLSNEDLQKARERTEMLGGVPE